MPFDPNSSSAGVKLSGDGSRLLPYARNLCAEYEKLQMQVDDLRGVQTGIIRIGTFSSVAEHWLPNIIRAFRKDYPGIDYELLLGDYEETEQWIAARPLNVPAFRTIGLALKNADTASVAVKRFTEYLDYREKK